MGLSALFMAVLGFVATFLPQELVGYSSSQANELVVSVIQVTGALYWGFAILNWMARSNLIGGIYSRPVALGNFLHFVMVALTMWRLVGDGHTTIEVVLAAVVYTGFAVSFGLVLFTHPHTSKQGAKEA